MPPEAPSLRPPIPLATTIALLLVLGLAAVPAPAAAVHDTRNDDCLNGEDAGDNGLAASDPDLAPSEGCLGRVGADDDWYRVARSTHETHEIDVGVCPHDEPESWDALVEVHFLPHGQLVPGFAGEATENPATDDAVNRALFPFLEGSSDRPAGDCEFAESFSTTDTPGTWLIRIANQDENPDQSVYDWGYNFD